jgi:hypothetical protein
MFTSTQSENPFKVFGAKIHMENIMFCWSRAGVAQIKYIYLLDRLYQNIYPYTLEETLYMFWGI